MAIVFHVPKIWYLVVFHIWFVILFMARVCVCVCAKRGEEVGLWKAVTHWAVCVGSMSNDNCFFSSHAYRIIAIETSYGITSETHVVYSLILCVDVQESGQTGKRLWHQTHQVWNRSPVNCKPESKIGMSHLPHFRSNESGLLFVTRLKVNWRVARSTDRRTDNYPDKLEAISQWFLTWGGLYRSFYYGS